MRDACLPSANGFFTARALAKMYDNFLESLGIGGDGEPRSLLLSKERVNEMRTYQVKKKARLAEREEKIKNRQRVFFSFLFFLLRCNGLYTIDSKIVQLMSPKKKCWFLVYVLFLCFKGCGRAAHPTRCRRLICKLLIAFNYNNMPTSYQ